MTFKSKKWKYSFITYDFGYIERLKTFVMYDIKCQNTLKDENNH